MLFRTLQELNTTNKNVKETKYFELWKWDVRALEAVLMLKKIDDAYIIGPLKLTCKFGGEKKYLWKKKQNLLDQDVCLRYLSNYHPVVICRSNKSKLRWQSQNFERAL